MLKLTDFTSVIGLKGPKTLGYYPRAGLNLRDDRL
jgi:hypothetical protein